MSATAVATLLRAVALAGGGGALVLAVLAWERFRGSPFGHLLALLSILLALVTALSVVSLALPAASLVVELVEAVTYTWLVAFVAMLVRLHGRLSHATEAGSRG